MSDDRPHLALTRVRGVGASLAARLHHAGFLTVADLARATSEALCAVAGIGPGTAPGIIAAAQALAEVPAPPTPMATAPAGDPPARGPEDQGKKKKGKKGKKHKKGHSAAAEPAPSAD